MGNRIVSEQVDIASSKTGVRPSGIEPDRLTQAIQKTCDYLLGRQHPDGYWAGELEADASVTAGYIPLMSVVVGKLDPLRMQKAANFVLSQQNEDGSWSAFPGGPGDLDVSVQVYFALKLAGKDPEQLSLQKARAFILKAGGVGKAKVFTRIWLAIFGQFDWQDIPSVPPEIIFFPNWFYINIYEFASWSRETILALAIVLTKKPVYRIPKSAGISELYLEAPGQRRYPLRKVKGRLSWDNFFLLADRLFKTWEKMPVQPGRKRALKKVAGWIVEHQEPDGSWGGIMLPWIYSLIALQSIGYPAEHPVMERGIAGLEDFIVEDEHTLRLQPATSPVWDTAWTILALREARLPGDHPALVRAAHWLLGKEIRVQGDWKIKNPGTEPGCWSFEFHNDLYPDLDDTPVVARALNKVNLGQEYEESKRQAIERARRWILSMQCRDGGWAAFDLNNDKQVLSHVPFADFMSPLDPTCADVTAHVIEFLSDVKNEKLPEDFRNLINSGSLGYPNESGSNTAPGKNALDRALGFLRKGQEGDGAWYGRWGVNYIYGTGLTLESLKAAGVDAKQDYVQKAVRWLYQRQNQDGGWGETCLSYEGDPEDRGKGPSTASQTAWALFGLLAGEGAIGERVEVGVRYLLEAQRPDGAWEERFYTGTGFPRAFYLHYDLYRIYFPLMALARFRDRYEEV